MSYTTCILESMGSFSPCSEGPPINLDTLDGSSASGGRVCKTSWTILSRMGINFLSKENNIVCSSHLYEFFEAWNPPDGCLCGEKLIVKSENKVNLLLAVKVLRSEGKVLPIGGPLCEACWKTYEETYAAKPGERVMIIVKKRKPDMSSIIKKEEPTDVKPSFVDLTEEDEDAAAGPPEEKRLRPDVSSSCCTSTTSHSSLLGESSSKYYCKLCKVTFAKESSYRLHKKSSLELHNRIKLRIRSLKLLKHSSGDDNEEEGWKCVDCLIAFKEPIALQQHLAEAHFTVHHPFHCRSCNFIFKTQSAFKSHNSRMHVSRIDKVYYCRECDDTFACKLKHARHILIHRPWNGDPDALQCKACGKVFTKHQTLAYSKHIKYHNDSEFSENCCCYDCSVEEEDEDEEGESSEVEEAKTDEEECSKSEDEKKQNTPVNPEDMSNPFQCSICPIKFPSPKELEEHVANGVHGEEGQTTNTQNIQNDDVKPNMDLLVPKKEEEGIDPFNFLEESMVEPDVKPDVKPGVPISTGDLLDKMKQTFQSQQHHNYYRQEEEDSSGSSSGEDDDSEVLKKHFETPSMQRKQYRGLPYAAYLKNNNLKNLFRRINTIAQSRSHPRSRISDDSEDEDENYSSSDLDESEDDEVQKLLIPMENGWVCEKKWEEDEGKYSTFFWSPDGLQHSSLAIIRFYGEKKNLNLNMDLFTRAVENNPPPP